MAAEREPEERNGEGRGEPRQEEEPGADLRGREAGAGEDRRGYSDLNVLEEKNRRRRQLGGELRELDRRIAVSEGYRLLARLDLLEKSYRVFDGNYLSLKHVLEEFEQPVVFLRLWEGREEDRLDLFLTDAFRSFHNYLAGATTLLEHTYVVSDDVNQGTRFADEYREEREKRIEGTPLPRFVEDLFSYVLRERLPFVLAELNLGDGGSEDGVEVDSALRLDIERLRRWKRWSERGREYLDTLSSKAKLGDIVEEHRSVFAGFYRWFVRRQRELHREALEELDGLKGEKENLLRRMGRLEDLLETVEKTAITVQEEREQLTKELEEQRRHRDREKARADRLEEELEQERNKGFFSRLFGR